MCGIQIFIRGDLRRAGDSLCGARLQGLRFIDTTSTTKDIIEQHNTDMHFCDSDDSTNYSTDEKILSLSPGPSPIQ